MIVPAWAFCLVPFYLQIQGYLIEALCRGGGGTAVTRAPGKSLKQVPLYLQYQALSATKNY